MEVLPSLIGILTKAFNDNCDSHHRAIRAFVNQVSFMIDRPKDMSFGEVETLLLDAWKLCDVEVYSSSSGYKFENFEKLERYINDLHKSYQKIIEKDE